MGRCEPHQGLGGCQDKEGNRAGAYTWSAQTIEYYIGAPFMQDYPEDNRPAQQVQEYNIHAVVHELGHAFANRFDPESPQNPYIQVGYATFADGCPLSSRKGYAPSPNPISLQGYWMPNQDTNAHETLANMFLGYIYDTWANDTYGEQRRLFMYTQMLQTWLPILGLPNPNIAQVPLGMDRMWASGWLNLYNAIYIP